MPERNVKARKRSPRAFYKFLRALREEENKRRKEKAKDLGPSDRYSYDIYDNWLDTRRPWERN